MWSNDGENGRKAENMCDVLDAVEQRGKAEGRVEGRTEAVCRKSFV